MRHSLHGRRSTVGTFSTPTPKYILYVFWAHHILWNLELQRFSRASRGKICMLAAGEGSEACTGFLFNENSIDDSFYVFGVQPLDIPLPLFHVA